MTDREVTRRNFLYGSAAGTAVALMDPPGVAAATVGVKRGDLPDLTLKEVKIYVGHMEEIREVRKAVGDDYVLMHDPVQMYNRFECARG